MILTSFPIPFGLLHVVCGEMSILVFVHGQPVLEGDHLSCHQGSRALVGHGISLSLVLCLYLVYIMLIIWQLVESYKLFPVPF